MTKMIRQFVLNDGTLLFYSLRLVPEDMEIEKRNNVHNVRTRFLVLGKGLFSYL